MQAHSGANSKSAHSARPGCRRVDGHRTGARFEDRRAAVDARRHTSLERDDDVGLALLWKARSRSSRWTDLISDNGESRAVRFASRFRSTGVLSSVFCALLASGSRAIRPNSKAACGVDRFGASADARGVSRGSSRKPASAGRDAWMRGRSRSGASSRLRRRPTPGSRRNAPSVSPAESTAVDRRSHAGPVWCCSEEFSVLETRSIADDRPAGSPVRTAVVLARERRGRDRGDRAVNAQPAASPSWSA